MCIRAHTLRRVSCSLAHTPTKHRAAHRTNTQSRLRSTAAFYRSRAGPRGPYRATQSVAKFQRSAPGFYTSVVVLSIAVGGALLFPLANRNPEKDLESQTAPSSFDTALLTDSYLVMAPSTPPGRPGTLTPEQEVKLRELWTATLKVFGVYEGGTVEANGADVVAVAPTETPEKDGKKEKKKSKLSVFKRHKGEKGGDSDAKSASGTATPTSEVNALSIADEDDKHGQNKEFKAAIANTLPEDLRNAFWSMVKHDHPDGLLLRFLRARKWDVEKALIMMISTMHWRMEQMHIDDDIMINGEEGALKDSKSDDPKVKKEAEDFLAQMRMGKSFLHGLDVDGRPLCVARARLHRAGEQSEASLERFTVYTIETARMLLRPPVDTATIVFDMTDFSMANMDYAPVKFMIKCFEANYPESLGNVLVYKAPWIFNAIWSIIRGWLDPVVAGKVHFAKNVEELAKYVPKSQIPTELGGDEKWTYEYVEPKEGENAKMLEEGPRDALQGDRSGLVEKYESKILEWVAEGEKGKTLEERRTERDAIAEELRLNYWKLDPYIRARSIYDRVGILGQGGQLAFYPSAATEAVPPPGQKVVQETSADDLD